MATDTNHAIENAQGWLETITAMIDRYNHANECSDEDCLISEEQIQDADCTDWEEYHDSDRALEAIQNSPLEVQVRSDWHTIGSDNNTPTEYKILLTTGGPALRIIGELDQYGEPETARLEWQDWGTQWTTEGIWSAQRNAEHALLAYAREFYYGS